IEKWPAGQEDCLTHVPLIVRLPGGARGHVVEEMVELYDIMPTMLALAETRASHTHLARDLTPQLHGAAGDPGRAAFTEGGHTPAGTRVCGRLLRALSAPRPRLRHEQPAPVPGGAAVRPRTHRYVHRPNGQSELYDVAADPACTRNLVDDDAPTRAALRDR